jgi:hypothetical protein
VSVSYGAGAIGLGAAATTVQCSLSSVPAGATIVLAIHNRSNRTTVIDSIADTVNGAWALDYAGGGPFDNTVINMRSWLAYFENVAAGNPTITVTFNGSINSQACAAYVLSDQGVIAYEAVSALSETTSALGSIPSNAAAISGAGALIGWLITNNAQADPEPVANGAGETRRTPAAAGGRTFIFTEDLASAGSYAFAAATVDSAACVFMAATFLEPGGSPPPSITDVNGDDEVESNSTANEVNGANFDTATLDIEQDDGPVAQDITAQNATTITFDNVFDTGSPQLKYGTATLRVTNDDDQTDTIAIALTAPTDTNYVDLTSVNPVSDYRITAIPDLAIGDQLQWGNVQGGTIADVTVNADATFSVEPTVTAFDVRAWDASTAEWGSWATQTIEQEFTTSTGLARDNRRRGMLIPIWGRG